MTFHVYTTLYNDVRLLDEQLEGQYTEPSYELGDYSPLRGGRPVAITVTGETWDDERDDTFFDQLLLKGLIGLYRAEDDDEQKGDRHV